MADDRASANDGPPPDSTAALPAHERPDQLPSGPSGTAMMPAVDPWADHSVDPGGPAATRAYADAGSEVDAAADRAVGAGDAGAASAEQTRAEAAAAGPVGAATWSARAAVPPPEVAPGPAQAYEWSEEPVGEPPPTGGSRATPLLIGLLVVAMLAALGVGVWLIVNALSDQPTTQPTVSASPTPPATTTQPPTTAARTTAAAQVPVPGVIGLTEGEARSRLTAAGLRVSVARQVDPDHEPGTVIDSQPAEGTAVPVGSVVRLVVAAAPPSSPSPRRSPSPSG